MITVRDSSEKVAGGFTLMTGATTASVVAINPTVEELKVIYDKDDVKEPNYLGTDKNGNRNVRIDVYVKPTGTETTQKFALFVSDAERVNKEGTKKQYTNIYGQISPYSWFSEAKVPDNQAKFFSDEGLRVAYEGEYALVSFIQAWANLKVSKDGDKLPIDFTKLFNGDFTQLNEVLTACNKRETPNTVGLMFGVRLVPQDDGTTKQYQDIYTKMFCRPYDNLAQKFSEQLNDPYGAWDRDYQGSTQWKEYSPTTVNVTEDAIEAGTTGTDLEDDLPW